MPRFRRFDQITSLAKFAAFSIGIIGTLLKGMLVGSGLTLGGLGIFGLGKMFTDLGNSVKDRFDKIAESSKKSLIILDLVKG